MECAILECLPGCLGLPSIDAMSIATICLLRSCDINYRIKPSFVFSPKLIIAGKTYVGFESISNKVVGDTKKALAVDAQTASMIALSKLILLEHRFLFFSDEGLVKGPILRGTASVTPFFRLFGLQSNLATEMINMNKESAFQNRDEVATSIMSHLNALDALLRLENGQPRHPLSECLAFAAISGFVDADLFASSSMQLTNIATFVSQSLPDLVSFVERIRASQFEDFRGSYHLRPTDASKETQIAAEQLFVKGRWITLMTTSIFAVLYFTVVNADTILNLISAFEEGEGEEPLTEAENEERKGE
mmetsp:Transcript_65386/g.76059  ORF Transcript_65386/g.76059 Transcript_65386/m.76059 type:complete len:305 (+) Transcript_65386:40-954(+)